MNSSSGNNTNTNNSNHIEEDECKIDLLQKNMKLSNLTEKYEQYISYLEKLLQ